MTTGLLVLEELSFTLKAEQLVCSLFKSHSAKNVSVFKEYIKIHNLFFVINFTYMDLKYIFSCPVGNIL